MVDLISKQTIIDGLEFVIEHGIETDGAHSISAEAMLEFVRELPIAEVVTDAISREQAIKALGELATFTEDWSCHTWMYTDDVYNAIKQLPPVQTEITHEQAIDYLHSTGWMQEHDRQMMLDGVHRLTAHPEPHWIPVTERLPDNSRNVLITHKGGVSMGWYNGSYFEKGASTHHRKIKTVTAWCELPEAYKGEKNDNI